MDLKINNSVYHIQFFLSNSATIDSIIAYNSSWSVLWSIPNLFVQSTSAAKTSNVESGVFQCFRWGRIAVLTLNDFKVKAGTNNANGQLITGLPSAESGDHIFTSVVYKFADGSRPAERFGIANSTGVFRLWNGNGTLSGSAIAISDTFIYLCKI